MFSWDSFRAIAAHVVEDKCGIDAELKAILSSSTPPPREVDGIGCPLPGSALIIQHPDPGNLLRSSKIRCDIAKENNNLEYVAYATRRVQFVESSGELSESNPLFIILIATGGDYYEFLYTPKNSKLVAAAVGHLGNLRLRRNPSGGP